MKRLLLGAIAVSTIISCNSSFAESNNSSNYVITDNNRSEELAVKTDSTITKTKDSIIATIQPVEKSELKEEVTVEKANTKKKNNSTLKIAKISFYGGKFHGRKTASGAKYNKNAMTAAHKTLKFGTKVRVVNPKNKKEVIVTVNDRGPFIKGRTFDLSEAAFAKIASKTQGVISIKYEIL